MEFGVVLGWCGSDVRIVCACVCHLPARTPADINECDAMNYITTLAHTHTRMWRE